MESGIGIGSGFRHAVQYKFMYRQIVPKAIYV